MGGQPHINLLIELMCSAQISPHHCTESGCNLASQCCPFSTEDSLIVGW